MTAVIIDSGIDIMRFEGCTRYQDDGSKWGIEGVDGWDGTPAVRESPVSRPQADGSYMPSRLTVDHRVITLRCFVKCRTELESSAVKDRVNDLMARRLKVSFEEPAGRREVSGFLSGDPATTMAFWGHALSFSLIITCPDPYKYGDRVIFTGDGLSVGVSNPGPLPVLPTIRAEGQMSGLSLKLGGHQVIWSGDTTALSLDFADMVPSSGVISKDDAFEVPHGESTIEYTIKGLASIKVAIRPAWR